MFDELKVKLKTSASSKSVAQIHLKFCCWAAKETNTRLENGLDQRKLVMMRFFSILQECCKERKIGFFTTIGNWLKVEIFGRMTKTKFWYLCSKKELSWSREEIKNCHMSFSLIATRTRVHVKSSNAISLNDNSLNDNLFNDTSPNDTSPNDSSRFWLQLYVVKLVFSINSSPCLRENSYMLPLWLGIMYQPILLCLRYEGNLSAALYLDDMGLSDNPT